MLLDMSALLAIFVSVDVDSDLPASTPVRSTGGGSVSTTADTLLVPDWRVVRHTLHLSPPSSRSLPPCGCLATLRALLVLESTYVHKTNEEVEAADDDPGGRGDIAAQQARSVHAHRGHIGLLVSCGSSLPEDVRDFLATRELNLFAVNNSCRFGGKCEYDWYQLVPVEILGALEDGKCVCYKTVKYSDYPRRQSAELSATSSYPGRPCADPGGWMSPANLDDPGKFRFGTFQPMMFSLTTVLEAPLQRQIPYSLRPEEDDCDDGRHKQKLTKRVKWLQEASKSAGIKTVDTDNVEQLKHLLNSAQEGFGTRFFQDSANHPRLSLCASTLNPLLHQHCEAIFQPLKNYMLRHFEHVRYVRPPDNWLDDRGGEAKWFLDLIAGFTPGGVLCGVYLTDLVSLHNILYGERIAEGGVDLVLHGDDKRLVRRPRLIDGFLTAG
ncbi:hypothetical protein PHYPSEUDO_008070 [Phytophthora pseudosyringae]|uniref:Uncharacterized protein n=1 Tax=Phytophthora pseudosyringae TaxID=221518 RepID=A0A8T1VF39_9STRA|nr:hypothetical protein PHYPSEUDO_008070 [Phytophthora pseudosyringae]